MVPLIKQKNPDDSPLLENMIFSGLDELTDTLPSKVAFPNSWVSIDGKS